MSELLNFSTKNQNLFSLIFLIIKLFWFICFISFVIELYSYSQNETPKKKRALESKGKMSIFANIIVIIFEFVQKAPYFMQQFNVDVLNFLPFVIEFFILAITIIAKNQKNFDAFFLSNDEDLSENEQKNYEFH